MKHLGSITDVSGADIPPVDIIAFGSPCQNLSVAGNRAGLGGTQSGLFHEAIRIIYEMREKTNGKYPTFIIWENVPGAFSSNKGRDFRTVLEEITKVDIPMPTSGRWAHAGVVRGREICAAWRQLDAQYWGVPQRRKRIFLVGSFGSNSAEEILFERDCVPRYLAPCGTTEEGVATDAKRSVTFGNRYFDARGSGDGNVTPQAVAFDETQFMPLQNEEDPSPNNSCYPVAVAAKSPVICIQGKSIGRADKNAPKGSGINEDVSFTLNTVDQHAVVYACDRASFNQGLNALYDFDINDSGVNSTLVAKGPSAVAYKYIKWIIRRLIPLECERLQGYPDYWTVLPKLENMTDEEFQFYSRIFCFDKEIRGTHIKSPPTRKSLVK